MPMEHLEFGYTNHRGEKAQRRIVPKRIWRGSTKYYPTRQLLLSGWDLDKEADRDFAAENINEWPAVEREASKVIRRLYG